MTDQHHLQLTNGSEYPYLVINSKRAKYIRIKLSNTGELSVVLPRRVLVSHAHKFIRSKTAWIEKNLKNVKVESLNYLPEKIELKLINESWAINYLDLDTDKIKLMENPNNQLEIMGRINDKKLVKKVINKWCQNKARIAFPIMLQELAETHGFHYNRLSIRSQKTRWGSCSNDKNISLNSKLLLMSISVVKYVMVHELCHTIEMNHSSRFWRLVEECDPKYKLNRKKLKLQGKEIHL